MGIGSPFAWLKRIFSSQPEAKDSSALSDFDTAVAKATEIHSRTPIRQLFDQARQNELSRALFLELHEVFSADEPKTLCRDKLVQQMLLYAPLRLLTLPSAPDHDPSGLRDMPGISGELEPHADDILEQDVELRRRVDAEATALDDASLAAAVERSFWRAHWFVESFNAARSIIEGPPAGNDWYRPFMHATCVNQEHLYRRMLQLPPVFAEDVAQTVVSAYSIYMDVVVSGADDPDREWREYCATLPMPPLVADGNYFPPPAAVGSSAATPA